MAKGLDDDLSIVRELANVLADTGLTEIELERGGMKLRVARQINQTLVEAAPAMAPEAMAAAPVAAAATPDAATAEAAPLPKGDPVKSPMVGTAYLSPSPGADAFINVGDTVAEGDTLMIVEAMKTMNAIKAPRAGKILEILARNSEPVEFDEVLVVLGN